MKPIFGKFGNFGMPPLSDRRVEDNSLMINVLSFESIDMYNKVLRENKSKFERLFTICNFPLTFDKSKTQVPPLNRCHAQNVKIK